MTTTERVLIRFDGARSELARHLLPYGCIIGHERELDLYRIEITAADHRAIDTLLQDVDKQVGLEVAEDTELRSFVVTPSRRRDDGASTPPDVGARGGEEVTIAVMDPNAIASRRDTFAALELFELDEADEWISRGPADRPPDSTDHASYVASVAALAAPRARIRGYRCRYAWDMILALKHMASSGVRVAVSACALARRPWRPELPIADASVHLALAFAMARKDRICCFAAAGNEGPAGFIAAPAKYGSLITIGGGDDRSPNGPDGGDYVAEASSRGAYDSKPDFLLRFDGYGGRGTSLGAARAAGLAACLLARRPTLTPGEVRGRFVRHCVQVRHAETLERAPMNEQGAGLLDERAFLAALEDQRE